MATRQLPHFMPEGYDVINDPIFDDLALKSRREHEAQMEQMKKMGFDRMAG